MSADSGQSWGPPQELMLPTPRPIKGMEVVAARYIRIVGGILIFVGGMALFGWVLIRLSWAPGATIAAKWQKFTVSPSSARIFMSLLVYEAVFLTWLVCLFWFRKTVWLLRSGNPAGAVVTHIRKIRFPGRSDPDFTVTLQFHDTTGNLITGKLPDRMNWKEALDGVTSSHFSINQVLTILYDPDKPTKFILYPPPGYEIGEPGSSRIEARR
jgi:hypothetical protein